MFYVSSRSIPLAVADADLIHVPNQTLNVGARVGSTYVVFDYFMKDVRIRKKEIKNQNTNYSRKTPALGLRLYPSPYSFLIRSF